MLFTSSMKKSGDFNRIFRRGKSAPSPTVIVYWAKTGRSGNLLGVTAGVKLGNAVFRNRAKRRLREVYRLNEKGIKPGFNFVLVARSKTASAVFSDIERDFLGILKKNHLLSEAFEENRGK